MLMCILRSISVQAELDRPSGLLFINEAFHVLLWDYWDDQLIVLLKFGPHMFREWLDVKKQLNRHFSQCWSWYMMV